MPDPTRSDDLGLVLPKSVRKSSRGHLIQTAHTIYTGKDGRVISDDWTDPNIFHDEGEQYLLARGLATALVGFTSTPASVYLGLDSRTTPAEADTLASLSTEPSTGGYARVAISTGGTGAAGQDFVSSAVTGAYRLTSKSCTFTNSSTTWTTLKNMFLCTVSSGTSGLLLASVALSANRDIATGESLAATIYIGLFE